MHDLIRRPGRLVALTGLLLATAGAGSLGTSAAAAPAQVSAITDRSAAESTFDQIVATAKAEYNNSSRNHEVGGCNYYTGHIYGFTSSGCPSGWAKRPWCADFVDYVWRAVGNIKDSEDIDSAAESVRQYGIAHKTWHHTSTSYQPKPGDALVLDDANGDGDAGHTGIVISADADSVTSIEGNWDNKISLVTRDRNHTKFWGFVTPVLEDPDTPPPPPPASVDYRVGSAGNTFGGQFQSFFQRADNHVLHHAYSPDRGWRNYDLGGSVASAPTTTTHAGDLWVVARGTDGQLKYRIHNGTAWDVWRHVPGGFSGAPALALQNKRLHIFVRSGSRVMYRFNDADTGWNADGIWRDLEKPAGVDVVSDPVTQFFDGRMFVFVRASDNQFYARGLGAKGWSDWTKLTGQFTGTPSAVVANDNTLFVFGRGSDGAVRYHSLTKGATGWAQNRTLDANIGGNPSAISFGGLMSVYARNGAGEVIYRTFDANGWSPWRELDRPAATTLDSSPVTMKYGGVRIAAARGADQQLYIRNYSATGGWSAWTLLSGTHAPMS